VCAPRGAKVAGIVERQVLATMPVRVEYQPTQMGREAQPVLDAVIAWPHRWICEDVSRFESSSSTRRSLATRWMSAP
jgi:DNA-binding HxlR family transcriptional regulator